MTTLDSWQVYRYYLALKLHFTTERYDITKQKGRVRASKASFEKRRDTFFIKKLAAKLKDKDVINFLIANFVAGNKWGGIFDSSAENNYKEWQRKIESISYQFNSDLEYLELELEKQKKEFAYIFETEKNQHPLLLQAYLGNKIAIETLIILDDIFSFINKFEKDLAGDIIWAEVSLLCRKYKPFFRYDKRKLHGIFHDRFRNQVKDT